MAGSVSIIRLGLAAAIVAAIWPAWATADSPTPLPRPPMPTADQPAYPTSPYHGKIDGDGRVIPCRCRFDGRQFRLGELVCMSTHLGTMLARCDLADNNTSWIPTLTACTVSDAPSGRPGQFAAR